MSAAAHLDRRQAVATLLAGHAEALVVSGLGGTSWDVAAAGDRPRYFYLWGAMGLASMTGLGLALARPRDTVLVITGDGEMLMGLGSLATVAAQAPANLAIVVIDNERYGETGEQLTHTAGPTDIAAVAHAAGIAHAETVRDVAGIDRFSARIGRTGGPALAVFKVRPGAAQLVLPSRDGPQIARRFRAALNDDTA